METIGTTAVILLVAVALLSSMGFVLSRYLGGRDDVADVLWGSLFVLVAAVSYGIYHRLFEGASAALFVTILVVVWAVRITLHVGRRFARSTQEDPRYVELRRKFHGSAAAQSYMRVFLLQGILALIIASPVVLVNASEQPLSPLVWAGGALWLIGFLWELVADRQLSSFVRKPTNKGKLMTIGLWRYSRHPNYFGELVQWWALGFIALLVPYGWVGLLGPLLLTFLIVKVSGVPLAEARASTKPDWDTYKSATSVLIPLPPKHQ